MSTKDLTDRQVAQAIARCRPFVGEWPDALLERETGQCAKVVERAMERALRRGFIEYGVTLRSAWLTPIGEQVLEKSPP